MTAATWENAAPPVKAPPRVDAEAYALQATYTTLIRVGAALYPRSLQNVIGSSELGYACDRRLAYKLAGTPTVNNRDPLVSLMGQGFHEVMADTFGRLAATFPGRFLIETPVVYRDVPGTCDFYDRELELVLDWKTSTVDKIKHLMYQGPAASYEVQTQTYAAGFEALGYKVRHVALAFVPRDGKELSQMWFWRTRYDRAVADKAIDRLEALRGKDPGSVPASPDRLCGWCAHFKPGSTNLTVGCPGGTK